MPAAQALSTANRWVTCMPRHGIYHGNSIFWCVQRQGVGEEWRATHLDCRKPGTLWGHVHAIAWASGFGFLSYTLRRKCRDLIVYGCIN